MMASPYWIQWGIWKGVLRRFDVDVELVPWPRLARSLDMLGGEFGFAYRGGWENGIDDEGIELNLTSESIRYILKLVLRLTVEQSSAVF
jgi:hypothetical protein